MIRYTRATVSHFLPTENSFVLKSSLGGKKLSKRWERNVQLVYPWQRKSFPQQDQLRLGHTVRVILTKDLSDGRGYAGEVRTVRAGYARNYLIPSKMALYATPKNFERVGIKDPDIILKAAEAKQVPEEEEIDEDLKAADLLRHYLRNKVLKIWRNVPDPKTNITYPGMVDHLAVRQKLGKQLKIDLEDHESVQLLNEPVGSITDLEEVEIQRMIDGLEHKDEPCTVKIQKLGEYVAKIKFKRWLFGPSEINDIEKMNMTFLSIQEFYSSLIM